MKKEHFIWLNKTIESNSNSVTLQISGIEDYESQDINIFLAITLLKQAKLLSSQQLALYEEQKNRYLYSNTIQLPQIDYTGNLASVYLKLDEESRHISNHSNYRSYLNSLFNSKYFDETIPTISNDVNNQQELQLEVMKAQNLVTQKIAKEINQKIETITVKYRTPPITLLIQPFKYDEAELDKLNTIANKIVKSFKFQKQSEDEGIMTITY